MVPNSVELLSWIITFFLVFCNKKPPVQTGGIRALRLRTERIDDGVDLAAFRVIGSAKIEGGPEEVLIVAIIRHIFALENGYIVQSILLV